LDITGTCNVENRMSFVKILSHVIYMGCLVLDPFIFSFEETGTVPFKAATTDVIHLEAELQKVNI
jgi:hypothetical protein